MWSKVLILLVGITLHSHAYPSPTPDDSGVEVEESVTTTMRTMMTSEEDITSGNNSDSVVVEAVVADESSESGVGGTDEAKEFDPNDCFLPMERGPCRAVIDSWFYNKDSKSCESFMWSGCGGNNNRFSEDQKCHQVCNNVTLEKITPVTTPTMAPTTISSTTSTPVVVTKSPKKITCPKFEGCSAKGCIVVQEASTHGCKICQCSESDVGTVKITRSTSTLSTEVNKEPVIGSVSGQPKATNSTSSSSMEDEAESKEASTDKPEDVCLLPEVRGNCRAMMTRYRWDGQKCVMFHFGGCDGNGNNFVTEKKCLEVCKTK